MGGQPLLDDHITFYADARWAHGDTVQSGHQDYLAIAWYPYTAVASGSNHARALSARGAEPTTLAGIGPAQVMYGAPDRVPGQYPLRTFEVWTTITSDVSPNKPGAGMAAAAYIQTRAGGSYVVDVGYPTGPAVAMHPETARTIWITPSVGWTSHA